jgi:sugar/nucleoside kinase (ribokinase family)
MGWKNILLLGGLAYDNVAIMDEIPVDNKIHATHSYRTIGGGAGNNAMVIRHMADTFGVSMDVTLFTKVGQPPVHSFVRNVVYDTFKGINIHDMVEKQTCEIPNNMVWCHPGGRGVVKQSLELAEQNADLRPVDKGTIDKLKEAVRKTDLVGLQTNYADEAREAAEYARMIGKPVVLDYSISSPDKAPLYTRTLQMSDYIFAPDDSVVEGMTEANPKKLYQLLVERHPAAKLIVVSGGPESVMARYQGADHVCPVERVPVKDQLGAGDTRTGAFAACLADGDAPLLALSKASAIATLSVQYVGRNWMEHMSDFVAFHPMFAAGKHFKTAANKGQGQQHGQHLKLVHAKLGIGGR